MDDFESSNVKPLGNSIGQFLSLINDGYINKDALVNEIVKHPFKSYRTIRRFVRFINRLPSETINAGRAN